MKRDMDLIRVILQTIEDRPANKVTVEVPGRTLDEIRLHLNLLQDVGLVSGVSFTRGSAYCMRMTFQGYDFLEAIRKDTVWQKAKDIAVERTGGMTLDVLIEIAKQLGMQAITGLF